MYSERYELLKTLRSNLTTLRVLLRDLDDRAVRSRPAPGEWSIIEVVAHLADTEERTLGRVRRMLDEDHPVLPAFDQEALAVQNGYHEKDFGETLERWERLRAEHVALLDGLDDAGWQRRGVHEENGPMTVQLYESHIAGEDSDHMAQIARLVPA